MNSPQDFDDYDDQDKLEQKHSDVNHPVPPGASLRGDQLHPSVLHNHEVRGVSQAIHSPAQFPIATPGHRHGRGGHAQASSRLRLAHPCGQHHREVGVVEATSPTRRSQGQTQGQTSTAGDTSNSNQGDLLTDQARRLARHQREGLAEHLQAQGHGSRRIPDGQGEVVLGSVAHHSEPTPARPFNLAAYLDPNERATEKATQRAGEGASNPGVRPLRIPALAPNSIKIEVIIWCERLVFNQAIAYYRCVALS